MKDGWTGGSEGGMLACYGRVGEKEEDEEEKEERVEGRAE